MPKKETDDDEQVDLQYLVALANKFKGKALEKALQGIRPSDHDVDARARLRGLRSFRRCLV